MVDTSPGARIGKLAHKAIYDLLVKAANDIRVEGVQSGLSTASTDKPQSN